MDPIVSLYEDVKKKALMRLEFDGLSKCEAITSVGARWFNDPAGEHLDLVLNNLTIYDFRVCHGQIRILRVFQVWQSLLWWRSSM